MDIPGITSFDNTANTVAYGTQTLGKEDFMNLLIKQLSYQDPLSPLDSKEFTDQLTQFSSLEELKNINGTLDDVLAFQQSMQNTTVTNLIGKNVKVNGNSAYLNDIADMSYDLAGDAASVVMLIYNAAGKIVRTEDLGPQNEGGKVYLWGGKDNFGNQMPEGAYTFEIQALDSVGNQVAASSKSSGKVTGINFDNGVASLVLNGSKNVYLSDILSIEE
jgi:flagellar basal-body rod modification protein FlgD